MVIVELIFGFLLMFAGRNLFWLCVGTVGFLVGFQCAMAMGISNGWLSVIISVVMGSVGALLAISFEWFMVIFGVGFLGGGYLLMKIFPVLAQQDPYSWLVFVVGGIVGLCLMVIAFDFTLIIISSMLGALLLVEAFHVSDKLHEIILIISMMIGILVQVLSIKDQLN